jgi:hypothetical protein
MVLKNQHGTIHLKPDFFNPVLTFFQKSCNFHLSCQSTSSSRKRRKGKVLHDILQISGKVSKSFGDSADDNRTIFPKFEVQAQYINFRNRFLLEKRRLYGKMSETVVCRIYGSLYEYFVGTGM